jgi:putative transposase
MIDSDHKSLSIARQCQLVSISRSGFYYQPSGETELNLTLMRLIDEQHMRTPFYGARQMARHLRREGYVVGRKRIRRLMQKMGLCVVYQRPRTTIPAIDHEVFPYLLRDRPAEPCLVRRHYVHFDAAGVSVSGGDHGLGESQCTGVETV